MSDPQITIAVVDDEAPNRKLLEKSLDGQYNVCSYDSAESCLAALDTDTPDLFLLDVRMPGGKDGFELCTEIRSRRQFADKPIMFISAMDSLEDKLKGYEAGADDYITKPIELGEIYAKVKNAVVQIEKIQKEAQNSQDAMSVAMTAMTNSGEIGEVNTFYENLHTTDSYEALAEHALQSAKNLGVNAVIQLRPKGQVISRSTTGSVNELEEKLMQQAQNLDRIHTFGKRCLFNFKTASILIRSMPEDKDKAGRYRDHLASVLNGVEARMHGLIAELTLAEMNQSVVIRALDITHKTLDEVLVSFKEHGIRVSQIMEAMTSEMEVAFSFLDLADDQEEHLNNIITTTKGKIDVLFTDGEEIDRKFESVIDGLNVLLESKK